MNKFFVIGMRGSGTTILWRLLNRHKQLKEVLFEPHDLMFAVWVLHLSRYKNRKDIWRYVNDFKSDNISGAKIALNPSILELVWKRLDDYFPECKYIFIKRNTLDNYKSLCNKDSGSVRGVPKWEEFKINHSRLIKSFQDFIQQNGNRGEMLDYDNMVIYPEQEWGKVYELLGINKIPNLSNKIKKPKHFSLDRK